MSGPANSTAAVHAEVVIESSDEVIEIIRKSLQPEVERPSSTRSTVSLRPEGTSLILGIEASDLTALRAALNSYLRWLNSILEVIEKTRPGRSPR